MSDPYNNYLLDRAGFITPDAMREETADEVEATLVGTPSYIFHMNNPSPQNVSNVNFFNPAQGKIVFKADFQLLAAQRTLFYADEGIGIQGYFNFYIDNLNKLRFLLYDTFGVNVGSCGAALALTVGIHTFTARWSSASAIEGANCMAIYDESGLLGSAGTAPWTPGGISDVPIIGIMQSLGGGNPGTNMTTDYIEIYDTP